MKKKCLIGLFAFMIASVCACGSKESEENNNLEMSNENEEVQENIDSSEDQESFASGIKTEKVLRFRNEDSEI